MRDWYSEGRAELERLGVPYPSCLHPNKAVAEAFAKSEFGSLWKEAIAHARQQYRLGVAR